MAPTYLHWSWVVLPLGGSIVVVVVGRGSDDGVVVVVGVVRTCSCRLGRGLMSIAVAIAVTSVRNFLWKLGVCRLVLERVSRSLLGSRCSLASRSRRHLGIYLLAGLLEGVDYGKILTAPQNVLMIIIIYLHTFAVWPISTYTVNPTISLGGLFCSTPRKWGTFWINSCKS